MIIKIKAVDYTILFLMFALLPIDMLNGFLLKNNINLLISVAQLFKIIILLLIFIRFLFVPKKLFFAFFTILLLLIPSFIQVINQWSFSFLISDLIKLTRYLMSLFAFLFFVEVIRKNDLSNINMIFNLVKFSYLILIVNIFIKYFGIGYPIYEYADIGSKGFFFAGNELSVLLIILSSIIAFQLWNSDKKTKFYLFLLLNMFAGITISSKTGMLGILIVFFLIPIKISLIKINFKRLRIFFFSIIIVFPILMIYSWRFIKNSAIFVRLEYFWKKFDFLTFILSNRNNFVKRAYRKYIDDYSFVEKIIGVGQTKYEMLNGSIVEIDIIDIFFAYGYIGLMLFVFLLLFIIVQVKRFSKFNNYIYANFVFLMILILFAISSFAGHVFSSGMSAVFIGLLFSLMYIRKDEFS